MHNKLQIDVNNPINNCNIYIYICGLVRIVKSHIL